MDNSKAKNIVLIILFIAVVTLTIAYAILTSHLSIESQSVVEGKSSKWDVHFIEDNNLPCTAKSGTTAIVNTQPTVYSATISGLSVTLRNPGDEVSCIFNIENGGQIDAKLAGFAIQDPSTDITYTGTGSTSDVDESLVSNGLIRYSVTYYNDEDYGNNIPDINNTLPSGKIRPIKLTIGIPSSKTENDIPYNDVVIKNFKTVFDYTQD